MKVDIKAIKSGLQAGIPAISATDKIAFGKYKNTNISDLMCTRPGYLLWLERNNIIILESSLKTRVKETVRQENIRNAIYESHYDEYDGEGDHDFYGLTAFDLGADF